MYETAVGGLQEIHNSLQRMRELAVRATNDTLTNEDRQLIQAEIEQLKNEIGRTAQQTEFGSEKLKLLSPVEIGETQSKKSDIVFIVDATGSMGPVIDNVVNNLDSFVSELGNQDVDARYGLIKYRDDTSSVEKEAFTSDPDEIKNKLNSITASGGGDEPEAGLEAIKDPSSGALSYDFRSDAKKDFITITDAPVHDLEDGDYPSGDPREDDRSIYDVDDVGNELASLGIRNTLIGETGSDKDQLERLSNPTGGDYLDIDGDFADNLSKIGQTIAGDSNIKEPRELRLQVGPDASDAIFTRLADARPVKLGISDLDVSSLKKAEESLKKLSGSINQVSSIRARMGSTINRLDKIKGQVSNHSINITSARSRIQDVNVAKERVNSVNNQIIRNAGISVLSQSKNVSRLSLQLIG